MLNNLDTNNKGSINHFLGAINEKNIRLIHSPIEKKFSMEAEELIERRWKEYLAENNGAYDGDLFELVSVEKIKDKLNIYYDYTKYRYIITTARKIYNDLAKNGNYVSNHIAIPTIVRTTDNKTIFGSDLTFSHNMQRWKFPGGIWEKSTKNIFNNVLKEFNEEVGELELINPTIIGINTCNNKTSITVLVDINLNSNEFNEFIKINKSKAIDSYELAEIKFVDLTIDRLNSLLNEDLLRFESMVSLSMKSMINYLKLRK